MVFSQISAANPKPERLKWKSVHWNRNYMKCTTKKKLSNYNIKQKKKGKKFALNQLISHDIQIQHTTINRVKKPDIYSKKTEIKLNIYIYTIRYTNDHILHIFSNQHWNKKQSQGCRKHPMRCNSSIEWDNLCKDTCCFETI